jgi:hypothetical protein
VASAAAAAVAEEKEEGKGDHRGAAGGRQALILHTQVWGEGADAPAGVAAQVIAAGKSTLPRSLHRQQSCEMRGEMMYVVLLVCVHWLAPLSPSLLLLLRGRGGGG